MNSYDINRNSVRFLVHVVANGNSFVAVAVVDFGASFCCPQQTPTTISSWIISKRGAACASH